MIRESVRIITNDEMQPGLSVTVTGHVEKFAAIEPERVRLIGKIGEPVMTAVKIVPRDDHPFRIENVQAMIGKYIDLRLEEQKSGKRSTYVLMVGNTKNDPGQYNDRIILKTGSAICPELQISVYGRIDE